MARLNPGELIAELDAAFRAMPAGVRALLGPVCATTPAPPPEAHVTQFGEYERVEESKFSPPALPEPEQGELPRSYGRTRLVLLVAGAYRVHAYWEVTPEAIARAEAKLQGLAGPYRAVLRFYDAGDRVPAGSFDIEVDLQARNWYVDLWSAEMNCHAELGLRGSDGRFVELARSNPVRTPRAWPNPELQEHFLRVEPAPGFDPAPPPSPAKPRTGRPAAPPELDPQYPGEPAPALAAGAVAAPGEAPPGSGTPAWAEALGVLERKLTELYLHRHSYGEPPEWDSQPPASTEPTAASPAGPSLAPADDIPPGDLTGIDERQFVSGVSSASGQRKHGEE